MFKFTKLTSSHNKVSGKQILKVFQHPLKLITGNFFDRDV